MRQAILLHLDGLSPSEWTSSGAIAEIIYGRPYSRELEDWRGIGPGYPEGTEPGAFMVVELLCMKMAEEGLVRRTGHGWLRITEAGQEILRPTPKDDRI